MVGDLVNTTEGERLEELADVLARGYQRHLASTIKHIRHSKNTDVRLDVTAPSEASCGSDALNPENQQPTA